MVIALKPEAEHPSFLIDTSFVILRWEEQYYTYLSLHHPVGKRYPTLVTS
jgi:hypothetical protein